MTSTPTRTYTPAPPPYCGNPSEFGWNGLIHGYPAAFPNCVFWADSVLTEPATLTGIKFYCGANVGGGNVRCAIYGGGLLAESSPMVPVPGWNLFPVANTYLAPATYKLAFQIENVPNAPYGADDVGVLNYPLQVGYGLYPWGPFPGSLPPTTYSTNVLWLNITGQYCPIITYTPSRTPTVTPTFTRTPTPGPPFTPTFTGTVVVNCAAVTTLNFTGLLSARQRADQPGGILDLGDGSNPVLPVVLPGEAMNAIDANLINYNSGMVIQQVSDLTQNTDYDPLALANHAQVLAYYAGDLATAQASGAGSYAWNQVPAIPPAYTMTKTVTDSLAHSRTIQILFWQVNDLGTANPPINITLPRQVIYAWYAFEITGVQTPGNANLLGGTGIVEGNTSNTCPYDRGVPGDFYWGDYVYFNPSGTLGSEGAVRSSGGPVVQRKPILYLPPSGPTGVLQVQLNFGTAGMAGYGLKDGLYSDTLGNCNTPVTIAFGGNLNSAQRADQPGGILQLGTLANPVLPFMAGTMLNLSKGQLAAFQGGNVLQQLGYFTQPLDTASLALPNHATPLNNGGVTLPAAIINGTSSYAWNQVPPRSPAASAFKAVTDAYGYSRQLMFQFYQVNDVGTAGINAPPYDQAAYAWYAFDVTGGVAPSNNNLIGGTGILEGDITNTCPTDRGTISNTYFDDFLYFNSDGSLASEGGVLVDGYTGNLSQAKANLYLTPGQGYGPLVIRLNFGTAGLLGHGLRDGVTGDAGLSTLY